MDSLNVIGMIVSPCPSHAAGINVVGNDIAVVRELLFAESAYSVLGNDLPVEEFPHFAIGAEFPVSTRMLRISNSSDAHLALPLFFRN
jgi:hypothetical protein